MTSKAPNNLYFGPYSDKRVAALHIKQRDRNMFFTITDLTGAVITSTSAKIFAADRKKRFAPHIVELATKQLALILKAYRIYTVRLFIKISKKFLVLSAARTLRSYNIRVPFAMDLISVPHNGCRKKKRRRL